ncbi:DUF1150 family protein [Rhodobacteraceae bacterium RKSG542]|uniref:BQ00720 family protein n=1 Tax=Pseudovibrio flavus TaxID=2529854 RepID=UPI0012BCDBD2|nr:DUF1150 family protein [Pseudovibrio flavus]MTI17780.1 DUF1150 family protein [Pseudovibrio flavus]
MSDNRFVHEHVTPKENFETMGVGHVAYVRRISRSDLRVLFPDADLQDADLPEWALLSADGVPIILTDTRAAAVASAIANELKPVSVH